MELNFKEKETFNSQQTLVNLLRKYDYFFEPVSQYENTQFYCVVKCEIYNFTKDFLYRAFKWLGFKKKVEYSNCPVAITMCNPYNTGVFEPIVFTQEDVKKIVSDVPERYVGEKVL